jgi:hypothetical protein
VPLPNTRVIHPDWSNRNRPVAEGAMTGECIITEAASTGTVAEFDEVLGVSAVATATVVYRGICRVQRAIATESHPTVADREVTLRDYYVMLPVAGPGATQVAVNHIVEFSSMPDDPTLVGRTMRVRGDRRGSLLWQRDLVCEDITPTGR